MPMVLWGMTSVLWVMTGLLAPQPASQSRPSLDFEFFQTQVQPIFLTARPGFTRCVVCHSGEGGTTFLEPLTPGATDWTDEESRSNFDRVSGLVMPGEPTGSRLLMHPLEPDAGGDEFHNGGRQFASQDDPDFQTISRWVRGETVGGGR
jgi:hypothetical protein